MPSVKPRIRARISPFNHNRLELLARQGRHSRAQIVDKALTLFFRNNEEDIRDEAFLRRLDLMTRHDHRHTQDLRVLSESFTLFLRYFFTVMPRINDVDRDSRAAEGSQHFNVFIQRLAEQMSGGGYTFKNALKDVLTTDNDFFTREEILALKQHEKVPVNDKAEVIDAAE